MFLKKRQAHSETDDILQQIKKKISDTGDDSNDSLSGQAFEESEMLQNTGDTSTETVYSDEDNELLNMLLSDDSEDEDDDDLNDVSYNNGDNAKADVESDYGSDNIVDDVNENDDEDVAYSYNNNVNNNSDYIESGEYVEGLESGNNDSDNDHRNVSVVDNVLNELKGTVAGSDGDEPIADQTKGDGNIDEDDIEFYDKNDGGDEDAVFNDSEDDISNNYQGITHNNDDMEDDNDVVNARFDSDDVGVVDSDTNVYDDVQQQENKVFANVEQQEAQRSLHEEKQNSGRINKSFNAVSISDNTRRSVRKNISNLIEQVKRQVVDERYVGSNRGGGSKTLEQIAVDLIQPVVIDYLNNNLERIVSDIVSEEIKRITDDIDK